ncbi:MAG TPA: STAS domain-containing protein [Acidimicrobiia bacterium]|jgi:anti-anti-sigma factor|nr:STAS domain-containing protein [Acidimicrobiia bacterium]
MTDRSIASLHVRQSSDGLVLGVIGELDLAGRDEIEPWVIVAVCVAPRVVLDLTDVTFCSSQGLAMLVVCEERARVEHCELVVVNPSARITQLLAITGLEHLVASDHNECAPSPSPSSRPARRGERRPARASTPASSPAALPSCSRTRGLRPGRM